MVVCVVNCIPNRFYVYHKNATQQYFDTMLHMYVFKRPFTRSKFSIKNFVSTLMDFDGIETHPIFK